MTRRVAIDFGTARTKLAYTPGDGQRPELLRFVNDEGVERSFVPSLFYLPKGNEAPLVGDAAEAMLQEDPAGVIDDLKRRLREPKCRANGRTMTPEDLVVLLFTNLRHRAAETIPAFSGLPPTSVTLTVPASFGPVQRDLLKAAAQRAGFDDVGEPIDEPVAAARAWLVETPDIADRLAVLDCGGGTVDWAYLRRDAAGAFRLVAACPPSGIDRLGGHDVDNGLVELVEHKFAEEGIESDEFSLTRRARLRARLRRMKETLMRGRDTFTVRIGDTVVPISREEVTTVIQGQFVARAADGLQGYLRQIGGTENGAEHPPVLLVGGSARLAGLREAIEALGCRVLTWDRADFAASVGALVDKPSQALVVLNPIPGPSTALVKVMTPPRPPGTVFREVDESWCPEMVVLPRGEFWMGSPKDEPGRQPHEGPRHRVRIDYDLAVGTCAVTFDEWDAWYRHVSNQTGWEDETTYRPSDEGWGRGDRPVINISLDLAEKYLMWLNERLGLNSFQEIYRLPSEAEWEYACRGGTDTPYWSGKKLPILEETDSCTKIYTRLGNMWSESFPKDTMVNFSKDTMVNKLRKKTEHVRSALVNDFGLYWIHGNVWELVEDSYFDSYEGAPVNGCPRRDGSYDMRVSRGGSFGINADRLRSASRIAMARTTFNSMTGFRVARRLS